MVTLSPLPPNSERLTCVILQTILNTHTITDLTLPIYTFSVALVRLLLWLALKTQYHYNRYIFDDISSTIYVLRDGGKIITTTALQKRPTVGGTRLHRCASVTILLPPALYRLSVYYYGITL